MRPLFVLILAACNANHGMEPLAPDASPPNCTSESYPEGAVEPMALGEVLSPYAWPIAKHRGTGVSASLELATVPCAGSEEIDWSPFDVLLFVSIPAW